MNIAEAYNQLREFVTRYLAYEARFEDLIGRNERSDRDLVKAIKDDISEIRGEIQKQLSSEVVPSLMGMENLKEERTKQWANKQGNAKGWDNYRASTFCEVIRAKWDRALQAQQLLIDNKGEIKCLESVKKFAEENDLPTIVIGQKISDLRAKIPKLEFDGLDSIKDAFNYSRECLQQIEQFPHLYTDNRLR
jgi:hypothetical protein